MIQNLLIAKRKILIAKTTFLVWYLVAIYSSNMRAILRIAMIKIVLSIVKYFSMLIDFIISSELLKTLSSILILLIKDNANKI